MQPTPNFGGSPQKIPTTRLMWMFLMLVAISGGILYSLNYLDKEQKKKLSTVEQVPKEEDDFAPPLEQDEPITLPRELASAVDDSTPIARSNIEDGPYRDLLSKVTNKTLRFLSEVLKFEEADHDRLTKKPGDYRGKTVYVRGELVDFAERNLETPVGDYFRVHFGVIRDFSGKLYWFETFSYDEENLYKVGQIAIAEGVFFKNFKYVRVAGTPFDLRDLPEQVDNLPMLICKSVRRSYRISEVSTLDRELARKTRCDSDGEQQDLEPEPLYHLLGFMKNLDPADIPKKITTYDDMANRLLLPTRWDKYRGEWVTLWGKLGPIYKHLDEENPAGITHHYRAYLWSSDRRLVSVFLSEKPKGFKPMDQIVEVRGIFFKPWIYRADEGPVRTPVIVAKTLTIKKFPETIWGKIATVLVIGLSLIVAGVVWIIYRDRRDMKEYGDAFIQRRRERRLKMEPPPIQPPASRPSSGPAPSEAQET